MANASAILALVGAILAVVTAVVVFDFLLVVPAVFAVIAGIYIMLQNKDNILILIGGAIATIVGLVAAVGTGMGWLAADLGAGLVIAANLEVAATALKNHWDDLPQVGAILTAIALVAAVVLALVFNTSLAFASIPLTAAVTVLALAGIYPAAVAMRNT